MRIFFVTLLAACCQCFNLWNLETNVTILVSHLHAQHHVRRMAEFYSQTFFWCKLVMSWENTFDSGFPRALANSVPKPVFILEHFRGFIFCHIIHDFRFRENQFFYQQPLFGNHSSCLAWTLFYHNKESFLEISLRWNSYREDIWETLTYFMTSNDNWQRLSLRKIPQIILKIPFSHDFLHILVND